ncbi:hypothetical protein ABT360_11510 [Streptomyces sp. NPDC000229]|uniref:hypothetical protein n=1 Tax=Streptomyces sp. NPDC000229 TaxID=3154247 RepID=UPI0033234699
MADVAGWADEVPPPAFPEWEVDVGVAGGSGGGAAWVWLVEGLALGSTATVSPPPTRATAVAATARRRCFFQRASCRRRAALPCPVGTALSKPPEGPGPGVSGLDVPAVASSNPSGDGVASSVVAVDATALWRRGAAGAMSGA